MSFYLKTAVLSVAIALLSNVLPFFEGTSSSPIWYCVILIYALLTIFSWKWIAKAQTGSAIKFTTAVTGITAIKILLTLVIITSYLMAKYPFPKQFAFGVFAVFTAFTVLFVSATQQHIKKI
ncbi:hypothetical protein N9C00_01645 [Flavobacteriales bacterium]|jgi:phosphatidylglycerophosphate synthase|nr:hypothetical protein [Flavobacteriales bacterium]